MKIKKCTGEGCNYEGSLWQSKPALCKNCAQKEKAKNMERKITPPERKGVLVYSTSNNKPKGSYNRPKMIQEKSLPELLKLAQIVFNRWIRERDSQEGYFTCISSGERLPIAQMNAGHYFPISTSSALRFDEDNCHGQSISENYFNPSHQRKYRENLIKKIGRFNLERLESLQHVVKKWSKDELIAIIEKYK